MKIRYDYDQLNPTIIENIDEYHSWYLKAAGHGNVIF